MGSGDEYDVLTPWRKVVVSASRAGVCKRIKRGFNRRERRFLNGQIEQELNEND